jgi:hypothetical protein
MADETTQTTQTNQTPATGGKTFTQPELDAILSDRLARERDKYKDHDAIKAELDKLKAGQMSDAEKANAKIQELEAKTAAAEAQVRAAQVKELKLAALEKVGLPTSWANRIAGEDAKSIEEDAKALQQLLGGSRVGGGTTPADGKQSENSAMNQFIRQGAGRG